MEHNTKTTHEIFNNTKGKRVKAHYGGGGEGGHFGHFHEMYFFIKKLNAQIQGILSIFVVYIV